VYLILLKESGGDPELDDGEPGFNCPVALLSEFHWKSF